MSSEQYWIKTRRLTVALLAIWVLITFVCSWYAPELNDYTILGFPLGFYMAAQGSLFIYLAIIGFYNWRMRRLETKYDIREE